MKQAWKKVRAMASEVSLVDGFLLLYMALIFSYTVIHLLTGCDTNNGNAIDVVVRTSAASIFGYFISGNFLKTGQSSQEKSLQDPPKELEGSETSKTFPVKNQIGFSIDAISEEKIQRGNIQIKETGETGKQESHVVQIIVVAMIGLASLLVVFVARFHEVITPEWTAIVSQLRDFIFAAIGFLISCGKGENAK